MKPAIPKGTRDFSPMQVERRQYIFSVIRKVFELYGYMPIETPVMENLSTLTGKYGDEGDKLLFKILNNGDFLSKADQKALKEGDSAALIPSISDRGLRYDLTVPFARYVAMHQNEISFPFKRYQIQQVWRADRPQRGRYREFYQCDADVIGSESLMYEAELIKIYDEVFSQLGLDVTIKANNRKILLGIIRVFGQEKNFGKITVVIDKLDKIGVDGVIQELHSLGIEKIEAEGIIQSISIKNLDELAVVIGADEKGAKGIEELQKVLDLLTLLELKNKFELDLSLARGLDYYTGCILEVVSNEVKMGSIGGGGRYDDLTGIFGLHGVSGVGISFGAERIYDILEELSLFPETIGRKLSVLFMAMDETSHSFAFVCLVKLRSAGIAADLYPEAVKLKKQMKYANDLQVPYTVIIGTNEQSSGQLTIKDMNSGDQEKMTLEQIIDKLK